MADLTSVLCAVDNAGVRSRVLRHAVGVASVHGARLTLLTVTHGDPAEARAELERQIGALGLEPPAAGVDVRAVKLVLGQPVDPILEVARDGADLLVVGTHGRTGVTRWLLGSTSAAILAETPCPTVLVPPGTVDIVAFDDGRARLATGPVLTAIDLDERNDRQVALAARLASLGGETLVALAVAAPGADPAEIERALAAYVAGLAPAVSREIVVRQGEVAAEIDRAAVAAHARLVVMGLRRRGMPGEIASAVAATKDVVVLAVPSPGR